MAKIKNKELDLNENREGVMVCKACGHPPECHKDGHIRLGFPCECELKRVPRAKAVWVSSLPSFP